MINIAELLKDAPKGMKLYSPLFGEVEFAEVMDTDYVPIRVMCGTIGERFDEFGRYKGNEYPDSECLLFPSKDCRTWEGWELPVEPKFKFKEGDWIATNIEQSKHLLELGLDTKTADMLHYPTAINEMGETMFTLDVKGEYIYQEHDDECIPAWSLSALLEVMPSNIGDYDLYITKHKYIDGGHGYNVEYNRGFTISVLHKGTSRDLVTAAYEMVCWLLQQGLVKKGGEE